MVEIKEVNELYPNLNAELVRRNLDATDVQKVIGRSLKSTKDKMKGRTILTLTEAMQIRDELLPGLSLEYLYSTSAETRNSA